MTRRLALAAAGAALTVATAAQHAAAADFNVEEAVAVCAGCHGEDGVPISEDIPVLWGQQFYYLYVQLKDFKAGRRASEIMEPIAAEFDKDQMKALAQYYADKTWPMIAAEPFTGNEGEVQRLMSDGQCTGCHNTFMGDSRLPRVAGQQYAYLHKTLLDLKNDIRQNAAAMSALMHAYTDDDLDQLARYLAAK